MLIDIKNFKAQISKINQSGEILGSSLSKLAGPLVKIAFPLAKDILAPLSISNWCRNPKENKWFRNNNFNNFTHKKNEDSNILLKGVTKIIKNKIKEQKGGLLGMLLGNLGASLWGNMLAGKGIVRTGSGNKKEKGIVRARYGNEMDF